MKVRTGVRTHLVDSSSLGLDPLIVPNDLGLAEAVVWVRQGCELRIPGPFRTIQNSPLLRCLSLRIWCVLFSLKSSQPRVNVERIHDDVVPGLVFGR
jgi:hypothetical protein